MTPSSEISDQTAPSTAPARTCPSCELGLSSGETTCPRCGKEVAEVKKKGKAKGGSSKAAKVPCPFCGELVSKRSKKCPACRTSLPTGFFKTLGAPATSENAPPAETPAPPLTEIAVQSLPVTESFPAPEQAIAAPNLETPAVAAVSVETATSSDSEIRSEPSVEAENQIGAKDSVEPITIVAVAEQVTAPKEDALRPADIAVPIDPSPPITAPSLDVSSEPMRSGPPAPVDIVQPTVDVLPADDGGVKMPEASAFASTSQIRDSSIPRGNEMKTSAAPMDVGLIPSLEPPYVPEGPGSTASATPNQCEAIILRSSLETSSWIAELIGTGSQSQVPLAAPAPPSVSREVSQSSAPDAETKPVRTLRKRKLKSAKPQTGQPAVSGN